MFTAAAEYYDLISCAFKDQRVELVVRPDRAPKTVNNVLAFGSGWTYGAPYDASSDGRFLALVRTEVSPPPRIRVVLGWDREVTRLGLRDRQQRKA